MILKSIHKCRSYGPDKYGTGFPLHFEIGGTFGLIPYFCTLISFGGASQNLGGKKASVEGKWDAEGKVFGLILPLSIYIFYVFKFLPQLKIERNLTLKGDFFPFLPSTLLPAKGYNSL